MGRNNKQRRAASKRKRRRGGGSGGSSRAPRSDARRARTGQPPLDDLLRAAVAAWESDPAAHKALVAALAARTEAALAVLDGQLTQAIEAAWQRGWTPVDVVQVTSRRLSAAHGDLAAALVVTDGRARAQRGQSLNPRWEAQLGGLAERRRAAAVRLDAGSLRVGVEVLSLLARLGPVPHTVPAPGAASAERPSTARLDERVLARVRALLVKAESTEFDEEAEALTAKAQELIARHAIDEALLHSAEDVGEPSVRRIPIDDPYADAKVFLLTEVGNANRCRVVYSPACGWVTAFGYDGDLDAVELLAASLLAQATGMMARHGSRRDASGRSRTRSFRRSFLLGFACRIGERLREATDGQVAATAAADAERLLPVLAARDDRLDAAVADAFPHLEHKSGAVSHAGGFAAGQAAADLADLDVSAGALDDARAS